MDALEKRLGVRLVQRTTRSVSLTEAGARFVERLRPALDGVRSAFDAIDAVRGRPSGTLRLTVPRLASESIIAPMLAPFLAAHPEVSLEVSVDDGLTSLVDGGFDAGIRLGEMLDKDVVAVRLTGDTRMAVVASPAYWAAHGRPAHPRELLQHACINYRSIKAGAVYRWEFTVDGRDVTIAVDGRVTTNDGELMLRAALDGLGVAYLMDSAAAPALADGRLEQVLAPYCPTFPGLYLYYLGRAELSPKLRALVEHLAPPRAPAAPTKKRRRS